MLATWRLTQALPRRATPRSTRAHKRRCEAKGSNGSQLAEQDLPVSRRGALLAAAAAAGPIAAAVAAAPALAAAAEALAPEQLLPSSPATPSSAVEGQPRFTHRVFLDIGTCPSSVRQDRRLGDKSILCTDPDPLGRIIIGLYGTAAPQTVANFLTAVRVGAFDYTLFSKALPGQYVVAGRQGSHRMGYVEAPPGLPYNSDLLESASFALPHQRPGAVSLNLAANEDEEYVRADKGYRNLSFLITTGPGPVPSLDGQCIVMGQVIEGMNVVASIAAVPTFSPDPKLRAFNQLALALGDDRASRARANWGKPITPVVILRAGTLDS